jgi:Ulp1 protease family, C-terminal catalytic domain
MKSKKIYRKQFKKTRRVVTTKRDQLFRDKISQMMGSVKQRCGPKTKMKKNYTCLEDETLVKLKELWNARHPDQRIDANESHEIWLQLNQKLKGVCNKESCWLKQKFVEGRLNKELKESFAPKSPDEWKKNPNEWLSSTDILDVMKQYEKTYKCFDFIGPSPIDFDTHKMYGECVWEELCNFNLEEQIKNGRFKIGIIFNTDPHDKGGSHWISMFINIKKGEIFFFDSAGDKAPPQVMRLVKRIIKQGNQLKTPIHFKFDQNYPVEHQYGNTECGIYSIYFIVHMLEDKHTSEYFKTHVLKDKYMEQFRKVYFNSDL